MQDYLKIGSFVTVTVDRPLGSFHPQYPKLYYPINYGFIEGTLAPDGEEEDAYILGVKIPVEKFSGVIIAKIIRFDDNEHKWVVAPEGTSFSKYDIQRITYFQEQYFVSKIMMNEND